MHTFFALWAALISMTSAEAATVSNCTGFTPPDPNFAGVSCSTLCVTTTVGGLVTVDCDLARAYAIPEQGVCPDPTDPNLIVVSSFGGHDIVAMAWDSLTGSPIVPNPDFCCAIDADPGEVITTVDANGSCGDDEIYFECGTSPVNNLNCTTPAFMASVSNAALTATARGRDYVDRLYGSNTSSPQYIEVLRAGDNGNAVVPDYLYGFGGDDELHGGPGNDILNGGTGNDFVRDIFSGPNNMRGEGGIDCIEAGSGADNLDGGNGNDILIGGGGNDSLKGSGDIDLLIGSDLSGLTAGTVLYDGDGSFVAADFLDAAGTTPNVASNADGATNTCHTAAAGVPGCSTILGTSAAIRAAALPSFAGRHPSCPL